jgi:hypothetical protein
VAVPRFRWGTSASKSVLGSDEGRTWDEPIRVVDFQGDGGYPSSVQLPDGQVLTAYYASRIEDHAGYHMGVVLWAPQGIGGPTPDRDP